MSRAGKQDRNYRVTQRMLNAATKHMGNPSIASWVNFPLQEGLSALGENMLLVMHHLRSVD